MKFLKQIASEFYKLQADNISNYCFVFPNRRAGLFFKQYIGQVANKPLFSPTILTIQDLFITLSGYQQIDKLDALFRLYKIYLDMSPVKESFDDFVFWGEIVFNDFDDVDKYMANAKLLFANVKDLKEIENDYSFLSPQQLEAILTFWGNFLPVETSEKKLKFKAIWELLFPIYEKFRTEIAQDNLAYEGMIFRKVAEDIKNGSTILEKLNDFKQIVFVGLNALNSCEKILLTALRNSGKADFYWDFYGDLITDSNNKSSFFMKENVAKFPSKHKIDCQVNHTPQIEIIGVPSNVGQAGVVSEILDKVGSDIDSAVVLPDESLLMPILYSIPKAAESINVTMGYSLKGTSVSALMESIIDLQKGGFYYRRVLPILKNNYISSIAPKESKDIINKILNNNYIYVPKEEFINHPVLEKIFQIVADQKKSESDNISRLSGYLLEILRLLESSVSLSPIEKEFVYYYYVSVSRLKDITVPMKIDTYYRILNQIINSTTIPFKGEPLSGLQVMGVLETRALDFENIVFCSMNEGVYPVKASPNSLIPYNLRKGFSLPSYEFQDSVLAYHFYRSIYRAKKVFLVYDTRTEGLKSGEVSRYIYQLKYHFKLPLKESISSYSIMSNPKKGILIEKTPELLKKIQDLFTGNNAHPFSATSINTYIDCSLKFYFSYIKELKQEEEVSESIEANTFGSIFHEAIDKIYRPYKNNLMSKELINSISKDYKIIEREVNTAFEKVQKIKDIRGHNLLIKNLIIRYINQVLNYDSTLAPFLFLESEKKLIKTFTTSNGFVVNLKAIIDRVDSINNTIKVIDYKTGSGSVKFESVDKLFEVKRKDGLSVGFQLLFYAMLIEPSDKIIVSPYFLKMLFKEGIENIEIDKDMLMDFKENLDLILSKIFDDKTPFEQIDDEKKCERCPFKLICK